MRNLLSKLCIGICLTFILSSCEDGMNVVKYTINSHLDKVVEVSGEEAFFELVAGTYHISKSKDNLSTSIRFIKTKDTPNPTWTLESFTFSPIDANNNYFIINGEALVFRAQYEYTTLTQLLNAKVGDIIDIKFLCELPDKADKEIIKLLKNIYSCKIDLVLNNYSNPTSSILSPTDNLAETLSADSSSTAETQASTDWDKILDEYEQYANQYISFLNKALEGDITAVVEYSSMLEKAYSLASRIDNANDNFSTTQMSRYMAITTKIAEAGLKQVEIIEEEGENKDNSEIENKQDKDWNKVLDEYDAFANQYIDITKKVAKGDLTALNQYPAFIEKAERLSSAIEDAEDEMTAVQLTRYNRITEKIAAAAKSAMEKIEATQSTIGMTLE